MIDTIGTEIAEGEERIRLEVADGIAELTLCRPDKLNGWSWESTRQLGLLADRIRFDPDVRVVLLRAEGRAFCAGIDVTAPGGAITGASAAERNRNYYEGIRWVHERFAVLARLPQPVVAAAQGYCLGFGFELALMADIRIAADDAVFALPEAQLGVAVDAAWRPAHRTRGGRGLGQVPGTDGPPHRRADGAAAQPGPTGRAGGGVGIDGPLPRGGDRGQRPLAVQGIKRAVDSYADAALPAALDRVAMTAALTLTSEDSREGYTAKASRRPPRFTGA